MNQNLEKFQAYQLAKQAYHLCLDLRLPYHLQDQLNRALSSAALNLAEGSARRTKGDKRKFYNIALASIRESQGVLDLARVEKGHSAVEMIDRAGACIYKLVVAWDG